MCHSTGARARLDAQNEGAASVNQRRKMWLFCNYCLLDPTVLILPLALPVKDAIVSSANVTWEK
jgi:hypothetical protein